MIQRNPLNAAVSHSEPLQQASFTAMKGIDVSKSITTANVVNELENLDVNTDGSVSIRKPLIVKRAYQVTYSDITLNAVKVFKTHVSEHVLVIYKDNDGNAYIAIETQSAKGDVVRPTIHFKCEKPDYSGKLDIFLQPVYSNIYNITGLIDILSATSFTTVGATVLGNTRLNLLDARVRDYVYNDTLYNKTADTLYVPRYLQLEYDPDTGFILNIKTPEVNTLDSGSTLVLDNNLTLDSPYAIRDEYDAGYNSVSGIVPYTYCTDHDTPAMLEYDTIEGSESTDPQTLEYDAKDLHDRYSEIYSPGFPLDTEYYISKIPTNGEKDRFETTVDYNSPSSSDWVIGMYETTVRLYIREPLKGVFDPSGSESSYHNVECPDEVSILVSYILVNSNFGATAEYKIKGMYDYEYVGPSDENTQTEFTETFVFYKPEHCDGDKKCIKYDNTVGSYYVEYNIPAAAHLVFLGDNPAKHNTGDVHYSTEQHSATVTSGGNRVVLSIDGYNNVLPTGVYNHVTGQTAFPNLIRYNISIDGSQILIRGRGVVEMDTVASFIYYKAGEHDADYEVKSSQHIGLPLNMFKPEYDADKVVEYNPLYYNDYVDSEIHSNWIAKAYDDSGVVDNVRLKGKQAVLTMSAFTDTDNPIKYTATFTTTVTDKLDYLSSEAWVFRTPYRQYTTDVVVEVACSPPTIATTLGTFVEIYDDGYSASKPLDSYENPNTVKGYVRNVKQIYPLDSTAPEYYPDISVKLNSKQTVGKITTIPLSGYTVEEITEKTFFPKFSVTTSCKDVSAATVLLKAFIKLTRDAEALKKYILWEYSLDGSNWESWYVLPDNPTAKANLAKYITSVKTESYFLNSDASVEADITSENSSIKHVDSVVIPIKEECKPSDKVFLNFNNSGELIDDDASASYTISNRADVLMLIKSSDANLCAKFLIRQNMPIESVMFRASICVPTDRKVPSDSTNPEDVVYRRLVSQIFTIPTGFQWEFANTLIGNAVLGDKLCYKKSIYSFNCSDFKNTLLVSNAGSFITPLSRAIDLDVSENSPVLNVVPWRNYLVALTSENVHLISSEGGGFTSKVLTTHVGTPEQDRRTCKAILNGVVFKSGSKIYTLYPSTSSGDETILNLSVVSTPVSHLLENVSPVDNCFAISTARDYLVFAPVSDDDTVCLKYTYDSRVWTTFRFKNVKLTDYHISNVDDIRLFGLCNGVYTEFYFDKNLEDVYPDIASKFGLDSVSAIPYGDVLTVEALNSVDSENNKREYPAVTPIHFKLDSGQRTDNISLTKKFQESKFLLATLNSKAAANIDVEVYIDGNPFKVRLKGDGIVYKDMPDQVLTLGENIDSEDADIYNTLSQVYLKYSGKGKTIRHVITGDSLYNFKLYEVFYRYRPMPNKQ